MWLGWTSSSLVPAMSGVAYPTFGMKIVQATEYSKLLETLKNHLKVLDNALNGKQFLVGSQVTLADLNVAAILTIPF